MRQYTIKRNGTSRQVVVTIDGETVTATLYVNHGSTITTQRWKGKTEHAARNWTERMIDGQDYIDAYECDPVVGGRGLAGCH